MLILIGHFTLNLVDIVRNFFKLNMYSINKNNPYRNNVT